MYRALVDFVDRNDSFYLYKAGDEYPRKGTEVDKDRVSALSTKNNIVGKPLIVKVDDEPESVHVPEKKESKEGYSKEDVLSMQFFSLRKLAKELGIETEGMKAPEMRDAVIEKLGL